MLVTEKIFGFLLAALAVQLMLDGLHSVGVIHLAGHPTVSRAGAIGGRSRSACLSPESASTARTWA